MEFTKDDLVVEGKVKVSVRTVREEHITGGANKIILKNNWIIFQGDGGVSVFNRENVSSFDIEFEEG